MVNHQLTNRIYQDARYGHLRWVTPGRGRKIKCMHGEDGATSAWSSPAAFLESLMTPLLVGTMPSKEQEITLKGHVFVVHDVQHKPKGLPELLITSIPSQQPYVLTIERYVEGKSDPRAFIPLHRH
jgi:hypothetical protein